MSCDHSYKTNTTDIGIHALEYAKHIESYHEMTLKQLKEDQSRLVITL